MLAPSPDVVTRNGVASLELGSFASWAHPLLPVRIYMHPDAIGAISSFALRSLKGEPPAEIGGLLWGRSVAGPSEPGIVIACAEFISSTERLYNHRPADTRRLIAALGRPRVDGLSCVGYFRSHIREGLSLSDEDQRFIRAHMTDRSSVFLIAQPFEMGICMAGLFFWDGDDLQTDTSDLEIPMVQLSNAAASMTPNVVPDELERSKSAGESCGSRPPVPDSNFRARNTSSAGTLPGNAIVSQSGRPNASVSVAAPVQITPRPKHTFAFVRWLLGALGLACLTGVGVYCSLLGTRLQETTTRRDAGAKIGLQVVRTSDGQLNLAWSQSVLQIPTAHEAKLTIIDDSRVRELFIDDTQLRSGKLGYFPSGTDIQFKLEIPLDAARAISESIRVLLPATVADTNVTQSLPARPVEQPRVSDFSLKAPLKYVQRVSESEIPRKLDASRLQASVLR
jgi:hypothetical protein